jgi:hypothetical protein
MAAVCIPMLFQIPSGQAEVGTAPRAEANVNVEEPAWSQLLPEELEQLTREKILVTRRAYRQIFEPYINPSTPLFITSDAVIHAFHVLFKESISRHEETNAEKLRDILKMVWARIKPQKESPTGKPADDSISKDQQKKAEYSDPDQNFQELRRAAKARVRIVIAVAIKLLGDTPMGLDARLGSIVDDEVERVISADGTRMPEWITTASPGFAGIDYSRFRPRGFYNRTELLRRYFRAVSWLQSIPFRTDKDEELLAIFMLGKTLARSYAGDYSKRLEIEQWFRCYNDLIGQRDDWDLLMASQIVRSRPTDLNTVRQYLSKLRAEDKKDSKISDQLSVLPETATESASAEFRIISAHRTPDAILFQRTTSLPDFNRAWPTGLEICAVLGSEFADQLLAAQVPGASRAAMLRSINDSKKYFETESFYNQYLNSMAALLDQAEPDAPAFINSKSWKTKSCNTALSGWSQIRHTWTLQAKQTVHTLGGDLENLPSGFVEPEPEFFARMGELVDRTKDLFTRCGAFEPSRDLVANDLRAFAGLVKEKKYPLDDQVPVELSSEEISIIDRSIMTLSALAFRHYSTEDLLRHRQDVSAQLLDFADDVEEGVYDDDPAFQALVLENNIDIKYLWDSLNEICRMLEVLAHKQLRGVAFSKRENYFLDDFGERLAAIMLYGGDSYRNPRDDAPSAVDIYHNPALGGYFHIGIARPREFLVLYPYQGREITCRGAVMPYYEFISTTRMTDTEWQKRLDSDERPENPDWLKPIFAPGDPQRIQMK